MCHRSSNIYSLKLWWCAAQLSLMSLGHLNSEHDNTIRGGAIIMTCPVKHYPKRRNLEINVAGLNLCKDILEEACLQLRFSVLRVSVPSPVVMAAANLHTPRSPSFQPIHSTPTWTMDKQKPAATATGMGMEPGTLSTTTQQDFMLTMAVMETKPYQARWETLASVLHTGEDCMRWIAQRCSQFPCIDSFSLSAASELQVAFDVCVCVWCIVMSHNKVEMFCLLPVQSRAADALPSWP